MSSTNSGKEDNWVARIIKGVIDIDRLVADGPTLKNAIDAMRSFITCMAMMLVTIFFYHEIRPEIEFTILKFLAIILAIWIGFYALVSAFQLALIIGLGLMYAATKSVLLVCNKTATASKVEQFILSSKIIHFGMRMFAYFVFLLFVCIFFVFVQAVDREVKNRLPPTEKPNPVQTSEELYGI